MVDVNNSGPDLPAIKALIPKPATSQPPGVTDSGSLGDVLRYAMENHTHASKARKEIKAITVSGLYTWTYPTPFNAGVVPVVSGIAICPTGTTSLVNVQGEGDPTNTQAVFRITVYQQSVASLLSLTILSLASGPPANTKLHLIALEP